MFHFILLCSNIFFIIPEIIISCHTVTFQAILMAVKCEGLGEHMLSDKCPIELQSG